MADEPNQGAAGDEPVAAAYGESPLSVGNASEFLDERPEVAVGGAFVAGFVVAQILKKVGE